MLRDQSLMLNGEVNTKAYVRVGVREHCGG